MKLICNSRGASTQATGTEYEWNIVGGSGAGHQFWVMTMAMNNQPRTPSSLSKHIKQRLPVTYVLHITGTLRR